MENVPRVSVSVVSSGQCSWSGVTCNIALIYVNVINLWLRTSDCGGTVSQNSTHIQSPGYPDGYTDSSSCSYTFEKASTDICAIRLDMEHFVTRGPALHVSPYTVCSYDYVRAGYILPFTTEFNIQDDVHESLRRDPS